MSPNNKKEEMPSTSKFLRNANYISSPVTERKGDVQTIDAKNDKKIEILMDIIKKKDYEIEKLQRLVKNKSQYIESIEVVIKLLWEIKINMKKTMLKFQKKENNWDFCEETEKMEVLKKKNYGIVQKAEEIKEKLEDTIYKESQKMHSLRKKNQDIVQKAEEIKEKLDYFNTPNIKKQNIKQSNESSSQIHE